jgi:cytochrome P450
MDSRPYEPFDLEFLDSSERRLHWLREHQPIYHSPQGYWLITRYEDVLAIQRRPELYSNETVGEQLLGVGKQVDPSIPVEDLSRGMPVSLKELMGAAVLTGCDDPKHAQLRRIVNRGFLPKRVKQWDEQIRTYTAECLREVSSAGPWEVVSTLAERLPVWVMGGILGVAKEDATHLKLWSDKVFGAASGPERGSREALLTTLNVMREMSLFFGPLIAERRLHPQEDLISDLVRAEQEETLSEAETLMFILLLMVAGAETTTNLIGNTIVSLLEYPDQLNLVHRDRTLIPGLIEESLRYRSPGQLNIRSPLEDTEIGGFRIGAGEQICMMLGAANRDPAQFANPDRFDITRDTRRHLAFGHGIHLCLGAHLARRETTIVMEALLENLPSWHLDGQPLQRVANLSVLGYRRIGLVPN